MTAVFAGLISLAMASFDRRRAEPARRGAIKAAVVDLVLEIDHYEDPATRRPVAADTPARSPSGCPTAKYWNACGNTVPAAGFRS